MITKRGYKSSNTCRFQKGEKATERYNKTKLNLIKISIIVWCFTLFPVVKIELENIILYKQGQVTKALVYRHTSKGRRGVSLYEFRISSIKYTGHDGDSNVGDSIEVVYLPKNPEINRNAEMLERDWGVRLYRKIKGDSNNK